MSNDLFGTTDVITQHVNDADLKTYFVGFDLGLFRYDDLASVLMRAIVDFAFGFHNGILSTYTSDQLAEAAKAIYKIDGFNEVKWSLDNDEPGERSESDIANERKFLNRGEFGELILHILLRDHIKTLPLISKIHFKDSDGINIHGFDCVHIGPALNGEEKSLYLGESKFYSRADNTAGEAGINDLIKDIKKHFKSDFLKREFALIGKKKHAFPSIEDYKDSNTKETYETFIREKEYWYDLISKAESGRTTLENILKSITIPLLCTYESNFLNNHTDMTSTDFLKEYEGEIQKLKGIFDSKLKGMPVKAGQPVRTNLNIVLMLFPIPSKKEIIRRLHQRLYNAQNV